MIQQLILILTSFSLVIAATGCGSEQNAHSGHDMTQHSSFSINPGAAVQGSIYDLKLIFEGKKGSAPLSDYLKGRPVVLGMIYLSCKAACPRIVADMKRIKKAAEGNDHQARYVIVTIDPSIDDQKSFVKTAEELNLDTGHWMFLKSDENTTLQLAHLIGMKYKKLPDGNFAHSNLITLLDSHGRVVKQRTSLTEPIASITVSLKSL